MAWVAPAPATRCLAAYVTELAPDLAGVPNTLNVIICPDGSSALYGLAPDYAGGPLAVTLYWTAPEDDCGAASSVSRLGLARSALSPFASATATTAASATRGAVNTTVLAFPAGMDLKAGGPFMLRVRRVLHDDTVPGPVEVVAVVVAEEA